MDRISGAALFLSLHLLLGFISPAFASSSRPASTDNPGVTTWSIPNVQHAYGLPHTRAKEKGTLSLNVDSVTFTSRSGDASVPRLAITAVSSGNERIELWGMKGRILRAVIPDGGGIAAAGVMHHKVGMLTVEFADHDGAYHAAVFYLPADDANRALTSLSQGPITHSEAAPAPCRGPSVEAGSVLVTAPSWDQAEVPAAYRALIYEHLVDRLQGLKGIGHVYREGEADGSQGCPQYTVHLAIAGFKQGSQVKRAVMGPIGMFVGTTQMTFNATFTDATGRLNATEQLKATVRGESENTDIANSIAKRLAKRYDAVHKEFEKESIAAHHGNSGVQHVTQ